MEGCQIMMVLQKGILHKKGGYGMTNLRTNVFIISGPSCSGKNTVYFKIKELFPNMKQTISVTTRAPRPGEEDGIDYYFVSEDKFESMINDDEFIEYTTYDNHLYGTLKDEIEKAVQADEMYTLIIDVNGALKIKSLFPDVVTIFVEPPSLEEIKTRLVKRGVNTQEEIETRLSTANNEMNQRFKYDYCVVNDNIEKAAEIVKNIILNHSKVESEE